MRFPLIPLATAMSVGFAVIGAEPEPIVRMLVPGFTVRELPVRLSNINSLRFGPDGRLFALGYDGRIHVLRDTDGDGLEDKDEIFWDKPTISVPVGMAWSKDGLYVSSHGRVSRLRDTDSDGKGDGEEIIASGWPPTDVGSGSVDATAVTLDKDGNVYFGLLVADYSNPYRLRKRKDLKPEEKAWLAAHGEPVEGDPEEEVSLYDINGMRGTIQKWSRQTRKLETIATGIRVPYSLAFNRNADLFLTDQEGETWCPNGNPLDELNHIIPGRNYGFPPRHEKYLPNLVSEPPVVAFGPQHQSTCGFVFNEPKQGQGLFGPKWWEGDAFVAGESRGKIWRVRLVKTPHGYVGKEYLIARLSMLTTDVAISPKGDLYVSCHSGLPDWGTGPQGEGKIFKISYTDPKAPQPVIAWAAGPQEVHVAFDKPLDSSVIHSVTNQEIEFGEYVRAADRYEVLKPPYKVVKKQEAAPRGKLKITAAKLDNDGQTLILSTAPHPQAVKYALTVPGVKAKGGSDRGATVDVDYDLSGVEVMLVRQTHFVDLPGARTTKIPNVPMLSEHLASYQTIKVEWNGWLPIGDIDLARKFLRDTVAFDRFERVLKQNADAPVFVKGLFQPPVTGAQLRVSGDQPFVLFSSGTPLSAVRDASGKYSMNLNPNNDGSLQQVVLRGGSALDLGYSTVADPTTRPVPLHSLFPPWVPTNHFSHAVPVDGHLELVGGDWEHGRELFFDVKLQCARCHRVRGEGGAIGPDLSNLVSRDAASVLRDIKEPSASINPDYVAYNVVLSNGSELTGFIRSQDNASIKLIGDDGRETQFRPTDVREMRPSSISLMPTALFDALNEESIRDLLTFLLNEPPKRSKAEVDRLLNTKQETSAPTQNPKSEIRNPKLQLVLVASKQDHGPGQHDYPAWQKKWHVLLGEAAGTFVTDAWEWPTEEQFQSANVLMFYFWNHDWSAARYRQLDEYLARGGGVVLLHAATIADKGPEHLAERIGLAAQPGPTKYRHTPFDLKFVAPSNHVITRGFPLQIRFLDEPYWPMFGDTNKIEVLATTEQDGKSWPMVWTFQRGKGRVFASILGHYTWTLDDPLFRILICRGICWAAGEPATRFELPVTTGTSRD